MRTVVRLVILLLTPSLLAGAAAAQTAQGGTPKSVEEAVLAVTADMERAAASGDVDRLFSFMLDTDKGSIIQNGEFMATRQDALQRVKNNFVRVSKVEYRWNRQHVTVLAPDVALLTAEGESTATTTEGQVFTVPFAQTVVFVLKDGRWKALHGHQSSPQRR